MTEETFNQSKPDPTYEAEWQSLWLTFLKIQELHKEIDNYKPTGQDGDIGFNKQLNEASLFMGLVEEEFYDCLKWVKDRIDEIR